MKTGAVCALTSGGPAMTVDSVEGEVFFHTIWFVRKDESWTGPFRAKFHRDELIFEVVRS